MKSVTGKPEQMKKMNMTLIYDALISLKTATRSEVAEYTKISITTVRSLLEELLRKKEIVEVQLDASSGGRRATRYALSSKSNQILNLYFDDHNIIYQINDLLGNVLDSGEKPFLSKDINSEILEFVSSYFKSKSICAIGLGVPGIVKDKHFYINNNLVEKQWKIYDIGQVIKKAFKIPVALENDLNAIAFGFALHYADEYEKCNVEKVNIAYIHFNNNCSGAGLITDGKIIHGASEFAGELGFLPMGDGKTLDHIIQTESDSIKIIDALCRVIATINCITNPSLIVIGGQKFDQEWIDFEALKQHLKSSHSNQVIPEVILNTHYRNDYLAGLSYLTIRKLISQLPITVDTCLGIGKRPSC